MRSRRSLIRSAVIVAVAALALIPGGGTAGAHSRLVSSDPTDGARLSTPPAAVTLTFNEAVQESFATLTVVGPDGNFWQEGGPAVVGTTASVKLRPLGPAGTYQVNYRVTSADGHPIEGRRSFVLAVAGTGTPGPSAAQAVDPGSGGLPVWPFIAIGVAVLLGGVGVVVWLSRKRT